MGSPPPLSRQIAKASSDTYLLRIEKKDAERRKDVADIARGGGRTQGVNSRKVYASSLYEPLARGPTLIGALPSFFC